MHDGYTVGARHPGPGQTQLFSLELPHAALMSDACFLSMYSPVICRQSSLYCLVARMCRYQIHQMSSGGTRVTSSPTETRHLCSYCRMGQGRFHVRNRLHSFNVCCCANLCRKALVFSNPFVLGMNTQKRLEAKLIRFKAVRLSRQGDSLTPLCVQPRARSQEARHWVRRDAFLMKMRAPNFRTFQAQ